MGANEGSWAVLVLQSVLRHKCRAHGHGPSVVLDRGRKRTRETAVGCFFQLGRLKFKHFQKQTLIY
jgi:hypothetical protein